MGRQRNNPQVKGKEGVSETMRNDIEASQLSDIEFKAMVIRKLSSLSSERITKNYREITMNSL